MPRKPVPTEDEEQIAVIQYCDARRIPVFHVPNGGIRHKSTAIQFKRLGVRAGVPDLFFPIAKGGYHGLFIEMKRTKGWSVSDNQKKWLLQLKDSGYAAYVCLGADNAIKCIEQYLTA